MPTGGTTLIIGDVTGHDLRSAVTMSHLRNMVRGIACDRQEPPGHILRRLDVAYQHLYGGGPPAASTRCSPTQKAKTGGSRTPTPAIRRPC
ncbi:MULTISPECIES: SpoIIE family protein phosphatase [unclassified Streptomyces]|uniref:SpoIIE family protein phosphatase n=1 Tax=unclassified Streptomyces TaxID=2593676 RepID=UPI0027E221DB|nr:MULTISPECIES: SpoIIE family protein phosphatase [unclassified Streptomyces]